MNVMIRRAALGVALTTGLVCIPPAINLGVGPALASGRASGACSTSFTLADLPSYLAFPPIAAGIAAGASSIADDTVFFDSIDKNGDGLICVRQPNGYTQSNAGHTYFVDAVDDHTAA